MSQWPRDDQQALINFYGDPASTVSSQLVKVVPPFRMTYAGKPLTHVMFHKKAAPALERALKRVWDYYGHDQKKVDALGISKTAGTFNPRKIRGSDWKWSNHAYGAAIDINAEENGFNVEGNIPVPMIAAFKAEGARWGGDYKGRTDPMHFEFCASGEPERTFEQWLDHYGVKMPTTPLTQVAVAPHPSRSTKAMTAGMKRRMMQTIIPYETTLPLKVNIAPDGRPEIAGITQKSHPKKYAELKELLNEGRQSEAMDAVVDYYLDYTSPVDRWTDQAGPNFFLRDSFLNRGPTGAAKILQKGVAVEIDGIVGDDTKRALNSIDPDIAVDKLTQAREWYEDEAYPHRRSSNQWNGMISRWDKAKKQAKAYQKEQRTGSGPEIGGAITTVIVGGGTAAATKKEPWTGLEIAMAMFSIGVVAFLIFQAIRWLRRRGT